MAEQASIVAENGDERVEGNACFINSAPPILLVELIFFRMSRKLGNHFYDTLFFKYR